MKDPEFLMHLRTTLGDAPPTCFVKVLKPMLSNAVRLLACNAYFHALGEVRFNRYQRYFQMHDRYCMSAPSPLQYSYAIVQIYSLLISVDAAVWELTHTYLAGLDQSLDVNDQESAVGRHLMSSYLIICLLALCYERVFVQHDVKVVEFGR